MGRSPLPLVLSAFVVLLLGLNATTATAARHSATAVHRMLSDSKAAALVHQAPETRQKNWEPNRQKPTASQLAYFRRHSDLVYKGRVTGAYTGTTDEIIQWAAHKWGLAPDLMRAVAAQETWWHNEFVGDNGDSFGLFQMRRPYHCCLPFMAQDTAFNADYYGGIVRAYYDGKQDWLNTVTGNSRRYQAGDLWGSVGAWCSGRWHDERARTYIAGVKKYLRGRVWTTPDFLAG